MNVREQVALNDEIEQKHHSLILLQRLLLANEVLEMNPMLLKESFTSVLFPLFTDIVKALPEKASGRDAADGCSIVKQVLNCTIE